MASRKKDRRKNPSPATPQAPVLISDKGVRGGVTGWFGRNWEGCAAILALVVSGASALFAYQQGVQAARQTELAELAYKRQTGRIKAEFTASGFTPNYKTLPKELWRKLPGDGAEGDEWLVVADLETFLGIPFTITGKNFGDEPVDCVRVEVRTVWDRAAEQRTTGRRSFDASEIGLKQVSSAEYPLTQKICKGDTVTVALTRLLLEQMMDSQPTQDAGRTAYGMFEVTVFGRLVGATTFDTAIDKKYIHLPIHWVISGFDKVACQKRIAQMQETPVINYDEEKALKALNLRKGGR